MATGVLLPLPKLVVVDALGLPVPGALATFYAAGTTSAVSVYADSALTTTLSSPVVADVGGRFVPIYLVPSTAYKLLVTDANGSTLTGYPVDNIVGQAVNNNADLSTSIAGQTIAAGQGVYLSDGSGALVAGRWYLWDSAQIYSSVLPEIGFAMSAGTAGNTFTVRLTGSATGLSGLAAGTSYYIGTAGALTSTAPTLARFVGVGDSTTSLVLKRDVTAAMWANDFRLTLTSGTPITTADVTAATTLYCSPLTGNRIDLPDANGNPIRYTSAEFSIAVPATTSQMYDVYVYGNAGVATLELVAWTNDTTPSIVRARINGRLMKTGDSTRMFLGSFRTTTVSGQTEDSYAKRYLSNYYNLAPRDGRVIEATVSWTYNVNTYRQARATATNQLDFVICVAERELFVRVHASFSNTNTLVGVGVGIGEDSTTTNDANCMLQRAYSAIAGGTLPVSAELRKYPAIGRHTYVWLETSEATGTTTWEGTVAGPPATKSGIEGTILG